MHVRMATYIFVPTLPRRNPIYLSANIANKLYQKLLAICASFKIEPYGNTQNHKYSQIVHKLPTSEPCDNTVPACTSKFVSSTATTTYCARVIVLGAGHFL